MARNDEGPWAVYQMTVKGKPSIVNVICEQSEWENLEKCRPGIYPLVRGSIASETDAERLAREPVTPMPAVPMGDNMLIPLSNV